ncbi:hypothetical protein D3C84_1122740 [compost metagenome]
MIVVVEKFFDFHQVGRVAVDHQAAPRLALLAPCEHLIQIGKQADYIPIDATFAHGTQHGEYVFLGERAQRLFANAG